MLERGGSVGEPEGHDEVLIVAVASAKRRLPFVAVCDANLGVSDAEIDLGEVFRARESIEGFANERKGIAILDRDAVEGAIVDAESKGAVFLLDEEDWSGGW